ncbi:gamma-tubulin complex component 6 isoform X3 [Dermacentor variabilis]|uniref:gamma-tubulin complex component 6 isoform X3 n=1 Tax=Dermacentor variabilis TaxID=34621 RepID=UPI003F5B234D
MEVDVPTLVTKLCALVAGGAKSDVPVKELRKLAFSILLKVDHRPATSPGTWDVPVEDRVLAKAFAMQLQDRHRDALQLRACITRLKKGHEHCSQEVQACLEFLLHVADSGPPSAKQQAHSLFFELPPTAPGNEQVPPCLVPGIPSLREYPRQLFEHLDDDLQAMDNQGNLVLPGLCAAEPGCDLNGNPLFSLHSQSWKPAPSDIPVRVPPLTAFTRHRVLSKFSKGPAKLEPLPAVRRPSKQAQPDRLPLTQEDWQYVMCAGRRKHFTWESVRCVTSTREHPFVTEAAEGAAEAVCQIRLTSLASLIGAMPAAPVQPKSLVRKALLLLVGIPSDVFPYDPVLHKFSIQDGTRLKGISSEALAASLQCFLECGRDIRFLEDVVSSNLSGNIKPPLTWQAFVGALRRFLHCFHGCLVPIAGRADTLTILQLRHIVSRLCDHVRCTTDICRSVVQVQGAPSQRTQSMLLLRNLCQHAKSCWGQEASSIVAFLLQQSCQPYLRFLEEWLYDGRCNDPYGEFPILIHKQEVEMRDESFWEKGFQYAASEAPFLATFMPNVFTSAKSAMLLKVCKPELWKLEMSPGNSLQLGQMTGLVPRPNSRLLWSKQLRPELRLAFSNLQLDETRESSECYSRAMESELTLTPLPEICLGLDPHVEIPKEWIKAQEERVDRRSRLLYAIPRSPSSNSRCQLSPCNKRAVQPAPGIPPTTAASVSHDDLLYSLITGTHMRVTGRSTSRVAMETEQPRNLGLFCEAAGTYGRNRQRNIFGHASDSQLHDILYPDCASKVSSKGNQSTAERNVENMAVEVGIGTPTGITSSPNLKPMMLSGSRTDRGRPELLLQEPSASGMSPDSPGMYGHSFEDNSYECEGKGLNQSCGDNPGLLLPGPTCDEAHSAEDGGGDASMLAADRESSIPTTANESFPAALKMTAAETAAGRSPAALGLRERLTAPGPERGSTLEPLASSKLAFFMPDSTFGDWALDGGLCGLPLEIAMKRSLLPPLIAQMKLLNRVCVSYLVIELRLYDHLEALTNYFCFQDGEFGQALCDAICHKLKSPMRSPAEFFNPRTLNWILSQALSSSLHGESAEAANLNLDACSIPFVIPPGQNIMNCLSMSYKVEWPLNVVITRACLLRYNKIFRFLLSLRQALWALSDIWSRLKPSALPRKPDSSLELRQLQLMRHEMLHFVHMVQSYVGSQVMQASLAELRAELNKEAQSVDDLRNAHFAFLKRLSQRLLLGRRAVPVRKLLHEALNTVLFFQAELAEYSWCIRDGVQLSHPSFAKFVAAHTKFQKTVATLQTASRSLHISQYPTNCLKLSEVLDFSAFQWPEQGTRSLSIVGKEFSPDLF